MEGRREGGVHTSIDACDFVSKAAEALSHAEG